MVGWVILVGIMMWQAPSFVDLPIDLVGIQFPNDPLVCGILLDG